MITLVTGIPRSGTSLMMQLCQAANDDIYCDAIRQEDINNPKGYFELEAVKGIVKDQSFLQNAEGKTIKIVAPLVTFIDLSFNYRVIFMLRDLDEVLSSQEKMLGKDQQDQREKLKSVYQLHIEKSRKFLSANHIPFLEMEHRQLFLEPEQSLKQLIDFCEWDVTVEQLKKVIDGSLYRNRKET
ncbi:MAG: sulfotransferase domain-containing protein [Flavobacteriales bacterium]